MNQEASNGKAGRLLPAAHSLAALEEHISRSKEIIRQINLPRYPMGGTVGIAAASRIMRHMAEADAELTGLKAQLNDYEQRMAANESSSATAKE